LRPEEFDVAFAEGRTVDPSGGAALCRTALGLGAVTNPA
jgi:hypothetical protein